MLTKTNADELENYLIDASNLPGGYSEKLFIPDNQTDQYGADVHNSATQYNGTILMMRLVRNTKLSRAMDESRSMCRVE